MPERILVIDDEESMCSFMEIMLSKAGYDVETMTSGPEGIERLRETNFDLVIADLNMPKMTGLEVLEEVKTFKAEQEFIVMTAFASVDSAIEAMKKGAADYITKPFKVDEIKLAIEKSVNRKALLSENTNLKKQLQGDHSFDSFIGKSAAVIKLKKIAKRIASIDSTVIIRGESGTGKDVIAKAIHHHSPRSGGPFISINCAALPETLLESELFGHLRGSFTGAVKDKEGLFMAASGGTFFLDEVGNTSLAVQVKLLRVLEDHKITPVGGTKQVEVNVRLIAATNSNLEQDVEAGRFRADLFYRLNVIPIAIPPLRERKEDISLLTDFFIRKFSERSNLPPREISKDAIQLLEGFTWPGNVRELENTIERAILLNRSGILEPSDFPEKISESSQTSIVTESVPETPTLESIEKAYIHFIMSQTDGKKAEAARILGINPSTLYRKLDRYALGNTGKIAEQQDAQNKSND